MLFHKYLSVLLIFLIVFPAPVLAQYTGVQDSTIPGLGQATPGRTPEEQKKLEEQAQF